MALLSKDRHHARDTNAVGTHGRYSALAVFIQNLHIEGFGVLTTQLEDVAKLNAALQSQRALSFWSWVTLMNLRRFNNLINLEITACNQTNHVVVLIISTGDPRSTGDHAWVSVDLNAIGVEATRANIALDQEGILLEVSIGS